jgi:BASS family bile acid:Na+ symporter
MVLLSVAIAYIPLAVALHGVVFSHSFMISGWLIARVVLTQGLVPLLAGIAVARLWPRVCRLAERYAERFINTVRLVVVLVAGVAAFRGLAEVGARGWLTCALIAAAALAIGHALGGPTPVTRTVLAITSAVRFPALALLFTSLIPNGARFIPAILAFVISSGVLSGIYRAAMARRQHSEPPASHEPLSAGAR